MSDVIQGKEIRHMFNLVEPSESNLSPVSGSKIVPVANLARNTVRQMAVLDVLARYGIITIQQIADALEVGNQNAKKTLKILRDKGDVSWCRWHDINNDTTLSGPKNLLHVLALTDRGYRRLIKFGNFPPEKEVLTRTWKGQSKLLPKMSHDRDVIRVLISLKKHLEKPNNLNMIETLVEPVRHKRDINDKNKTVSITSDILSNGKRVIADAVIRIQNLDTKSKFTIFLEYENYSASWVMHKRASEKLVNYKNLFLKRDRHFSQGQPLLFYVVSKKTRINEIFKLDDVSPMLGVLRVAHIDDVLKDPLGKSWVRGSMDGGRFKLHAWSPLHG